MDLRVAKQVLPLIQAPVRGSQFKPGGQCSQPDVGKYGSRSRTHKKRIKKCEVMINYFLTFNAIAPIANSISSAV